MAEVDETAEGPIRWSKDGQLFTLYTRTSVGRSLTDAVAATPAESRAAEGQLLEAVRNYINACTMVRYDATGSRVSREVAEREAFQRMQAAADRFPHPCAATELPKGPNNG